MALEAGAVFTRLGARFDDAGFDRFDRRLRGTRADAERGAEAELRADVNTRGFDRFGRELDQAERQAREKSGRIRGAFKSLGPAAAAAGAAAGAGAALVGKSFIDTATDIAESTSKLEVVLGGSAGVIKDFADTSAATLGISRAAALDAGGSFASMFRLLGQSQPEAARMGVTMTQLAADMASFNNASPEEALTALQAGLRGEAEPLRRFNVLLDDATLRQQAVKDGIVSTVKDALTPQQKAMAAYRVILEQTKTQQGDFERTSGGLANQQRILKARLSDVGGELGGRLMPIAVKVVGGLNNLVASFTDGSGKAGGFARAIKSVAGVVRDVASAVVDTIRRFIEWTRTNDDVQRVVAQVRQTLSRFIAFLRDLGRDAQRIFRGIGDDLRPIGLAIITVFRRIEDVIQPIVRGVLPGLGRAFRGAFNVIAGVVKLLSGLITGDFDKAWDGAKQIVKGAVGAIIGLVEGAWGGLKGAAKGLAGAMADGLRDGIGNVLGLAAGFVNKIIDVVNKLPGVNIGHVRNPNASGPGTTRAPTGPRSPGQRNYFAGGIVDAPIAIVGEEAPQHPEVIIPSNPAYRPRALMLWRTAGAMLGIPGFAAGGVRGASQPAGIPGFAAGGVLRLIPNPVDAGKAALRLGGDVIDGVTDLAGTLKGLLPANPIPQPFRGLGNHVLDEVRDYIGDKAAGAWRTLTSPFRGEPSRGGAPAGPWRGGPTRRIADAIAARFDLRVGSGYRDPAHNAAVGGVPNSLHTHGTPANPGAWDLTGAIPKLYAASAFARRYGLAENLVHDVGSGLHLHLGFFARGGIRGLMRKQRQRVREYEDLRDELSGLERAYSTTERRYDQSEEILIDPDTGALNKDAIEKRAGELDKLATIRRKIRNRLEKLETVARRTTRTYGTIISRLEKALKSAKKKDRPGLRDQLSEARADREEWSDTLRDLGYDVADARLDVTDVVNEAAAIRGTRAEPGDQPAAGEPGDEAPAADQAPAPDPDLQAIADAANARAAALEQDLAAVRSNLAAFTSAGDIGAGGVNAFAAATSNAPVGAGVNAGYYNPTGMAPAGPNITVEVRSFLPPTGDELARIARDATAALDSQPHRPVTTIPVG